MGAIMNYPKSLSDVRAMLLEYVPAVENAAYTEAIEQASPVTKIVGVFNALKDAESLDDDGRRLLCGTASLIARHQWHGLANEALEVFAAVYPTLPAETPDVDPVI